MKGLGLAFPDVGFRLPNRSSDFEGRIFLKIDLALYSKGDEEMPPLRLALISKVMLGVFVASIVVLGVYPEIIRQMLR